MPLLLSLLTLADLASVLAQLSTFALTMFRKEVELDDDEKGKIVKVGACQSVLVER